MSIRMRLTLVALALLVFAASLSLATKDRELKQCQQQCRQQYESRQRAECERRCEDYFREKREWGGRGEGWYEDFFELETDESSPVRACQEECDREEGGERKALCHLRCQQRFHRGGDWEGDKSREWQGEGNPYIFDQHDFSSLFHSEQGTVKILKRFNEKSKLLWNLKNYRLGFMDIAPSTFVSPAHLDADVVYFIARGRGSASFIREEKQESINLEKGDIVYVPSGVTGYLLNKDSHEKLFIIKLLKAVNLPGVVELFHGPGSEQKQSFYEAFSDDLLSAVFNADKEELRRIFGKSQGIMAKASKEQIQALSRHEESPRIWPFTKETIQPFNLFKRLVHGNNYGQLFEATPEDFAQLRDIDISVSFANISEGSISGPFYNSKSTKIAFVWDGEGYVEIICPHVAGSREHGGKWSSSYRKIRSELRRGSVFVVPAGHPVATVASPNNNLRVVCFEVQAQDNVRFHLSGKKNVYKNLEAAAKELSFGAPAREVDRLFNKQNEEFFFPFSRHERRHQRLADA